MSELTLNRLDSCLDFGVHFTDLHSRARQSIVLEPFAQLELVEFAGGGVWQFFDEDDIIGKPPGGDFAGEELQHRRARKILIGFADDDQQRPLLPFRVRGADDGGFGDRRMRDGGVSMAIDEIHSPPDLMTSFERSVICM